MNMISPKMDFENVYEQGVAKYIELPVIAPEQVQSALASLTKHKDVSLTKAGTSFNGLPLNLLKIGHGSTVVFGWSQMHGDESTATAAICDFLNLLLNPECDDWVNNWTSHITLYLLPMLNPDGALANTRINAQGIDINRDADAQQSPEGRVLRTLLDKLKPDVALNLHDQSRYYRAGTHREPATMSFLSPPGDVRNSVTPQREKAMWLINQITEALRPVLGDKMARYVDTYSQRAFGDYATSIGAACILIESGAHDAEKPRQVARKMNVLALITILDALVAENIDTDVVALYEQLPVNVENGMTDLLIRRAHIQTAAVEDYQVDIAIDRETGGTAIREVGDLSTLTGFDELDASGLHAKSGKSYVIEKPTHLDKSTYKRLLSEGFSHFAGDIDLLDNQSGLPVSYSESAAYNKIAIFPGCSGTLLLVKSEQVIHAIVDGKIIDLR